MFEFFDGLLNLCLVLLKHFYRSSLGFGFITTFAAAMSTGSPDESEVGPDMSASQEGRSEVESVLKARGLMRQKRAPMQKPSDKSQPGREGRRDERRSHSLLVTDIALGKFELNQFPCARINWCGSRVVSVVLLGGVLDEIAKEKKEKATLLEVQEWLSRAKEDSLASLVENDQAFMCTVGPGDLLYLPPGSLVSHKVNNTDLIGIRLGFLHQEMLSSMMVVQTVAPANKAIGQGLEILRAAKAQCCKCVPMF